MFDPTLWSPICFGLCFVLFGTFAALVHWHRGVLLGFSMMAVMSFFLTNLSGLFITNIFFLDDSHMTPDHIVVYLYTIAGLFAYAAGLWWAWRPLRKGVVLVNPFVREGKLVYAFLAVGVCILLFARFLPFIPTVSSILFRLSGLVQLAFIAAIVWTLQRGDYARLALAAGIFIPVALFNVVITGFAGMIGLFMLHPSILFLFWRKVTVVRAVAMCCVVYCFFLLASVWFSTRSLIREGGLREGGEVGRAVEFYSAFANAASDSVVKPEVLQVAALTRIDLSSYNAIQVGYLESTGGYSYGKSLFVDPLLALIPRLVWKDKTISLGDSEFINRYTGLVLSNDSISVDTNITFELYANFGWIGVVIGLFFFGLIIGKLELALCRPGIKLRTVVVISIVLLTLSSGGRRAAAMALEIGTSAIAAYILGLSLEFSGLFVKVFHAAGAVVSPARSGLRKSIQRTGLKDSPAT